MLLVSRGNHKRDLVTRPSITAPAKIVKMKDFTLDDVQAIQLKLEVFQHCVEAWIEELAMDIAALAGKHTEPDLAALRNVKPFPTNGRKPKLLKTEQQPAA